MATIESTNNNILTKFEALGEIDSLLTDNEVPLPERVRTSLYELTEEYELGSINTLSNYFSMLMDDKKNRKKEDYDKKDFEQKKDVYLAEFQEFVKKDNYLGKMDRIFKKIKKHIKENVKGKKKSDYYEFIKVYENSVITKNIKELSYKICTFCNVKMTIRPNSSELVCEDCGFNKKLSGTVFEDDQFYYQEGQRTKHGNYDPTKHCRIWVERIQARGSTEIPEKVIKKIKKLIAHDRVKDLKKLSCADFREYLRKGRYSKYNEHVPLIRKIITGEIPPQLTDNELQLINIYFDKSIRIYEEVKPEDKTNCPYHPYFIYKIIDEIIGDDQWCRKAKILSNIHLQSPETLIKNDRTWKKICPRIGFTYRPTDQHKYKLEF